MFFFQIFTRIKDSDEGHVDLVKASEIMKRIMKRELYRTCQVVQASEGHPFHGKSLEEVEQSIRSFVAQQQNPEVKPEDILVLRSKATMGMGKLLRTSSWFSF